MSTEQDTIPVADLDQFVHFIEQWHGNRLAQLEQMLSVPADVEIRFGGDDGEDVVLPPEHRAAFHAGLVVAKDLFGSLPFIKTPIGEEEPAE